MSQLLNETKAVKSHNFYPAHYFSEAIQSDIKEFNGNSEKLKSVKKTAEAQLTELFELKKGSTESKELRQKLIDSTYKALGFYDISQTETNLLKTDIQIRIQHKDYSINASKRIPLRGHGELWLFDANLDLAMMECELASDATKTLDAEHCFDLPGLVDFKGQATSFAWKEILSGLYDCDAPYADWILVNTGIKVYLFEKSKWQEEEAYLELNIQELFELNHDETYKLARALFSPNAFPINTADFFHEKIAYNAHKKASEVTKALRDTVRESIELIANAIIQSHKEAPLASLKKYNFTDNMQREQVANIVFEQSLKYVYRMLFMLFTESQDHSKGSLPVNSKAYQRGYSIEKLRDLVDIPLQESASGHFIQHTLEKSFGVYFQGYHNDLSNRDSQKDSLGFSFPSLGTSLFDPDTTPLLLEVKINDGIMQQVLRKMSLAKVGNGKHRRTQRVHYAGLGLNQLGAVYEGLLSLKPEILNNRVILLIKEPKDLAHRYIEFSKKSEVTVDKILRDEETEEIITKEKDEFLLTPVGLERKFSASFYTPEVLTRFVAKEAVDALLEKDGSLQRLESIKILEPAMGSGAFLNAVVDELAPKIAKFKEIAAKELRTNFLQKHPSKFEDAPQVQGFDFYKLQAKSYLMKHSVYGIDLNPVAVELAKVSLWLNCLHTDGNLPFMDFKLRLGNSLVGGWVQKHYEYGKIPHWFFPNPATVDAHLNAKILGDKKIPFITDLNLLEKTKSLKNDYFEFRNNSAVKAELEKIALEVERLYALHITTRKQFQSELAKLVQPGEKEKVFEQYIKNNHHYNQLRFAMDIWCSLWFWPHNELEKMPTSKEFLKSLKWCLQTKISSAPEELLKQIKDSGISFLEIVRKISLDSKFFHYDLEFAEVFADGGFDLVLGNPPWAPVRWEEADFFEDVAPGIHDLKTTSKEYHTSYHKVLKNKVILETYKNAKTKVDGYINFLSYSNTYSFEDNSKTNTYKYFYQRFYASTKENGIHGMIAQDGIISDNGCLKMREKFYRETVKLYRFVNHLNLFEDVDHNAQFCIWFNKRSHSKIEKVNFTTISNLFHPTTVEKCMNENINSNYPGLKNEFGKWELNGHPNRILNIDEEVLQSLATLENSVSPLTVSLPTIHGKIELDILQKLAQQRSKLDFVNSVKCSTSFHESEAAKKGLITRSPGIQEKLKYSVMSGPNIFVSNPAFKNPNPGCKNPKDFSAVDLLKAKDTFYPGTVYKCTSEGLKSPEYNLPTPWGTKHVHHYRIFSRAMVFCEAARTLSTAIVPPDVSHIHGIISLSFKDTDQLICTQGLYNSIIFDYLMRSTSGGNITQSSYALAPFLDEHQLNSPLISALKVRALRLSCISDNYNELWAEQYNSDFKNFQIDSPYAPELSYKKLGKKWERNTCIRDSQQREQALSEIDAIVAIIFGFDKETLLNLYRSQFGVLQSNLQDLPNQVIDKSEFNFPRYQAMADAYDQAIIFVEELKNKARETA